MQKYSCHINATCNSTKGSWECFYNNGYDGDGASCEGMCLEYYTKCVEATSLSEHF